MSRTHLLVCLLALGLAAGCKAQSASNPTDTSLNRHISILVRAQLGVPASIDLAIGARKPSPYAGFDSLPIVLSQGKRSTTLNYLISTDNKTLARMETLDIFNDPIFSIDVAGRPVRGNPDAKVTVINFDDLECPYCARMHQSLFPATLERYKDKVRFVYKDNPLVEIHPWAMHAAVDANCLAAQNGNAYWAFVDYIHAHSSEVTGPDRDPAKAAAALDRLAHEQGTLAHVNGDQLQACIAKQDESRVRASMAEAQGLSADGAPVLFINGERIVGWVPEEQLWNVIDRALKDAGVDSSVPDTPQTPAPGK